MPTDRSEPSISPAAGQHKNSFALHALGLAPSYGRLPSLALIPARIFLGLTFIYAGLQKFTDSQFFSPTAPGFIGKQMSGFVHTGSPLSALLTPVAIPHATVFGAFIALSEIWVGLSALLGLLSRLGAIGGLGISLTLYLTATWSIHPYFLGADLPYALAWLTLAIAGPTAYSLDEYYFRVKPVSEANRPNRQNRRKSQGSPVPSLARGQFLRGLTAIGMTLGGSAVIAALAKLSTPSTSYLGSTTSLSTSTNQAAGLAAPAGYTTIGTSKQIPLNAAGQYVDPLSGDPALLVHLSNGQFVAYDAVCTHAGCTVGYDPSQQQIVCPCHGASFDPAHQAQVVAGPAPTPLAALQVKIDSEGTIFALGSPTGPSTRAQP